MPLSPLHTEADRFVDAQGRQVILRGLNLGGDSKVPFPHGGTQYPCDFSNHRDVSFVGRPFPLEEADTHLARIRHWGFNCLRLLTSWEAVEHRGPSLYDKEYLEYYAEVCRKAGEHGLYVFVDFHQDVWSRMSGGDGAPGWVFESVGLDFTRFDAAGAAHVMQQRFDYANSSGRQEAYPQMSWSQNYRMPANAILWTLFWAGSRVTPDFRIGGKNVQEFLQSHLLGAMSVVAEYLKDMPHVIGFDSLNEPGTGWLGQPLSPRLIDGVVQPQGFALPGLLWSPLEGLAVATGLKTELPVVVRDMQTGSVSTELRQVVNANGQSIWCEGVRCPFEQAGIYRVENGRAVGVIEDAFTSPGGYAFDLSADGYAPFFSRVANTIRQHRPEWLLFAEMDPFGALSGRQFPDAMPNGSVNASHWYDVTLLIQKSFNPALSVDVLSGEVARGPAEILSRYERQLSALQDGAKNFGIGGAPTLIGEFGIPYDLDDGVAYEAWAEGSREPSLWIDHTLALSLMYDAMDALLLNSTQWNYTAHNRNDLRIGDQWNQEDLSIFSLDQFEGSSGPDAGGRAIEGFCRPYVRATQGQLNKVHWSATDGTFEAEFIVNSLIKDPTEIYLPTLQFQWGCTFESSGAKVRWDLNETKQLLRIWALEDGIIQATIRRTNTLRIKKTSGPKSLLNTGLVVTKSVEVETGNAKH